MSPPHLWTRALAIVLAHIGIAMLYCMDDSFGMICLKQWRIELMHILSSMHCCSHLLVCFSTNILRSFMQLWFCNSSLGMNSSQPLSHCTGSFGLNWHSFRCEAKDSSLTTSSQPNWALSQIIVRRDRRFRRMRGARKFFFRK